MHHPKEKHLEYHKMNNNKEKVYKSNLKVVITKNRKFKRIKINKILIFNKFLKVERFFKI